MPGRPVTATLHEGPVPNSRSQSDAYSALEQLGKLMDSQFVIPGLGIRFGVDALLGLVPGLGDFFGGLVSLYILGAAAQQGVSRVTITRMGLNVVIDMLLGSLPFIGDLFDVAYKANYRNVALLKRNLGASEAQRRAVGRADKFFVVGILFALFLLLIGTAVFTASLAWMLLKSLNLV
jgi:hypothetical protein